MATHGVNNQGIIHLSYTVGGHPFCGSRHALMSTTPAEAAKWPRICTRCKNAQQKRLDRKMSREQRKAALDERLSAYAPSSP